MPFKPFEIKMTEQQVIDGLRNNYGNEFTTPDVRAFCAMNDIAYTTATRKIQKYKVSKGRWNLKVTTKAVEKIERSFAAPSGQPVEKRNLVPEKDDTFVKFGSFGDVKKIIQSKQFYPTFVTGLSGNGKTLNVLQSCAELNRECIRVNVTIETDEDDLLGGFRLVNGETAWHDGPVVDAMKRGAVLLLDEIDLASNKIMCLQPILEGKGVFLKKINEYVEPAKGFNIVATANTKGKGSEDGRFIGTNVLNEAFLERFPITFEQSYPSMKIETNIVLKVFQDLKINDKKFAENLVKWADVIRKTFYDGGIDEIISTRRIVHIANAYAIFKNKMKAIQVCTNRFDEDTKNSFLDLYTKVDAGEDLSQLNAETETDSNDSEEGGPIDND